MGLYDEEFEEDDGPGTRLRCPSCGEPIDLRADPGGGEDQSVIEDCPVCCRPMTVHWQKTGGRWRGFTEKS